MNRDPRLKTSGRILDVALLISKSKIDNEQGKEFCLVIMDEFEAQIRQDQKEKCAKAVGKLDKTVFFNGIGCYHPLHINQAIMEADQ